MQTSTENTSAAALWRYNATLLKQAMVLIERLQLEAQSDFVFGKAVGPHVRHIIEHHQALLTTLADWTDLKYAGRSVDYDARQRDLRMQSEPEVTLAALQSVIDRFQSLEANQLLSLDTPLTTRLQAGLHGEWETTVPTSLGRELLFVASHTVHHYALLGHYCKAAGVDPGEDFGKAPATVAFEQAGIEKAAFAQTEAEKAK